MIYSAVLQKSIRVTDRQMDTRKCRSIYAP